MRYLLALSLMTPQKKIYTVGALLLISGIGEKELLTPGDLSAIISLMKILITNNTHDHYDRVGEIVGRQDGGWVVSISGGDETILTYVDEKDFKPTPDIAKITQEPV